MEGRLRARRHQLSNKMAVFTAEQKALSRQLITTISGLQVRGEGGTDAKYHSTLYDLFPIDIALSICLACSNAPIY